MAANFTLAMTITLFFSIKGTVFFSRDHSETFQVSSGMEGSGMPGAMYEKGTSILVFTPFPIRLGVLQGFKTLL